MPVGAGERFYPVAAASFLSQTYAGELELVVIDNSDTAITNLPDDPRIKYHRSDRLSVGALRNLGTSLSTGEVCVSIDEDDWSHPDRVATQVERLQSTGKAVTGFHSILYFEISNGNTYRYHYDRSGRPHIPYACGSSQCYLRSWWDTHKFPESGIEDFAFQQEALHANQLDSTDGAQLLVARAHDDSECYPRQLGIHQQFPSVAKDELPPEFYAALTPTPTNTPAPAVAKAKAKTAKAKTGE